ncbi:GlsB/YeaQ/YmgE family stress response membrane protein [Kocuria sp. M1N1S27]|uniref:GlsB/YeaQ/YmgE family stress response membrane protein n=1 Tax=Kocuria kalidii TaxID=3376283 RepID=UPI00378CF940
MGILGWIILGLIAGALAKLIMPGNQGGGIIVTMILGIVGALLGGFIGSLIGIGSIDSFWDLGTWITAIVGALIVLFIWGLITGRKGRAH